MNQPLLEFQEVFAKKENKVILDQVSLIINKGEQWGILGKSGSGKTSLAHAIIGRLFYRGHIIQDPTIIIELIEQQHRFKTLSNTSDFYYQQRFQSQDAEDALTINQVLTEEMNTNGDEVEYWLEFLHLSALRHEPLIQLSNGENKRVQLCKSLLRKPSLLILDMPFTGLDTEGRNILHQIINRISSTGFNILLITSIDEMPDAITHIAELEKGKLVFAGPKKEYVRSTTPVSTILPFPAINLAALSASTLQFNNAVQLVNVCIRYGDRTILNNVNWTIKKGERWNLSGPNGAGKSTLLSLITADNPQAYANEIYLFDKRKGRGESIWDIKKNIGLVSPEMHLFFPCVSTCFEAVASGLFDTTGLFRPLNDEQEKLTQYWIDLLNLQEVAQKPLQLLSLSQQRMALLGRALVKNPPLLVLDEPCQGLDDDQISFFNNLINQLCGHFNTTIIYVSHYRNQLPEFVNRRMELREGEVAVIE